MRRARGQDGLTLLETLVMIAVTALVGAALMNVATRANAANYTRAARSLDTEAVRRVETDLRSAAAAAGPGIVTAFSLTGDSRSVSFETIGYAPCAKGRAVTSFAIEASGAGGGRLVRRCGGRTAVLAAWPTGVQGDFAFSSDGFYWSPTPPSAEPRDPGGAEGVYLRFRLRGPGAEYRTSVIRLGGAIAQPSGMPGLDPA